MLSSKALSVPVWVYVTKWILSTKPIAFFETFFHGAFRGMQTFNFWE